VQLSLVDKTVLVTGGGSGIGKGAAAAAAAAGAKVMLVGRNADKLAAAAEELRGAGFEVEEVAGNMADEDTIRGVVAAHKARFGRLDVLVNNAGVGVGAAAADHETKRIDLQLAVNLRAIVLFYRESIELLKTAGAEHRNALVVNLSSISGKSGQPWLSVYSATKAAVIGWTQAMNKELQAEGIKSVALCPAFVDTPMTEFVREHVKQEDMIQPSDVGEAVRYLLHLSPACRVPEIVFERVGESL
jgi:NAD(P)-dependent dehydrogenase (short-subunit alcohol dehydrogenase family)